MNSSCDFSTRDIVIVTGGSIKKEVLFWAIDGAMKPYIIGVDKGLERLHSENIAPDLVIGDFDSVSSSVGRIYKLMPNCALLKPEKDYTDTHVAVSRAIKMKPRKIIIVGATGTRLDHTMANINILKLCLDEGIDACIVDSYNRISLCDGTFQISKTMQYGNYISVIPYSDVVSGLNITGFKYDVCDGMITKNESIGISNELREEEGLIQVSEGIIIICETKD